MFANRVFLFLYSMKSQVYVLLILLSSISCHRKTDNAVRELGREYYNEKVGSWIVYKVDSLVLSDFNQQTQRIDTFNYQVKEVLAERFLNAVGNETNRIERFKRIHDTDEWKITNVWTTNINDVSFEKVEENARYVKMVFPVAENKFWNGNQYNLFPVWDYTYRNIKKPATVNGFVFNNSITVIQKDSSENNFIEKRFAMEIYASGIGMIYKQMDTVEVQNNIKKGLYYRQSILDWSK